MNNELSNVFREYKKAFKDLDNIDKKVVLIRELEEAIILMQEMCEISGIKYDSFDTCGESDDYLDNMFTKINILKELIGSYSIGIYDNK